MNGVNEYIRRNPVKTIRPDDYYCGKVCKHGPYDEDSPQCKACCEELLKLVNDPKIGVDVVRATFWASIEKGTNDYI